METLAGLNESIFGGGDGKKSLVEEGEEREENFKQHVNY